MNNVLTGFKVVYSYDIFSNKVVAIISTTLVIGAGGSFAFLNGMIPLFELKLPVIATAAVWGILLNFFNKDKIKT